MSRYVKQFRLYGRDNENNYPAGATPEQFMTGDIFKDYLPIVQLGVQYNCDAPITFFINNSKNPILSHPYGLYELDLEDKGEILSLKFNLYNKEGDLLVNPQSPLIVDIVYEG